MQIKNTFIGGKMNKDLDERLVPKGDYIHAENVRIITPDGSNSGSVRLAYGTTLLTGGNYGTDHKTLGHVMDREDDMVYYAVLDTANAYSYIVEYDIKNDTEDTVLVDTRGVSTNALTFQEGYPISMSLLNDSENGKKYLFLTDDYNEPKCIEVNYAKTLADSTVSKGAIRLLKAAPLQGPTLTGTNTSGTAENYFEDKLISYAYRYKYVTGEYSALSPFSMYAFEPKDFDYNTEDSSNNGMINKYNTYSVFYNTGQSYVTDIEIVFKEAQSDNIYISHRLNKVEEGLSDNGSTFISVSKNKIIGELSADEAYRVQDNVPVKAKVGTLIGNRYVLGNYTEGYDLTVSGAPVIPQFSLDYVQTAQTAETGYNTMKTNRDYEIAIVYLDEKGRKTTPITSNDATTYIRNLYVEDQNHLRVTISSLPPDFAESYQFYIRQSKRSYDNIITGTVERVAGTLPQAAYILINPTDVNKISVGDYLYFKGTSNPSIKADPTRVKILAIENQEADFLGGGEAAGLYITIENEYGLETWVSGDVYSFETDPIEENENIFYELPRVYNISPAGYHLKSNQLTSGTGTDQTASVDAVIVLDDVFNASGWGNGVESSTILDKPGNPEMFFNSRPSSPIEDYKAITRKASLTYGGVYENSTGYNALNVFNNFTGNFKDMDTAYGSIQLLHSRDTNLFVFQEDKTHRVLYQKDVLFDADGSGNIRQSNNILGQEIPFAGEYGICKNPESFATYANRIYHLDLERGCLLRLSLDGYTEISQNGMHEYFRTLSKDRGTDPFVGGYNPYDDVYLINSNQTGTENTLAFSEKVNGFVSFYSFVPEFMFNHNNRLYSIKEGEVYLHDSNSAAINRFYGTTYPSKLSIAVNDIPSEIKVLKSISIEGTSPWDVTLRMYGTDKDDYVESTIDNSEFIKKEGQWFSYTRRNELTGDFDSQATYGIGQTAGNTTGNTITISGDKLSSSITIGDEVYDFSETLLGNIVSINGMSITLDTTPTVSINTFVYGKKNNRIEGSQMRGYTATIDLELLSVLQKELFAVNSEVFKSFM